jgi:hypothetical protein
LVGYGMASRKYALIAKRGEWEMTTQPENKTDYQ